MWDFYKQAFATVQLATVTIGWTIYQATFERPGPAAVFFVSAQAAAMAASAWAGTLRKKKVLAPVADRGASNRLEGRALGTKWAMVDSYRPR
jgi:hypothetical protein